MILAYAVAAGFWYLSSILAWHFGDKAGREDERYNARNSHSRNPTPCARVRQATGATTEWMPRPIGRRPCDSGVERGDDSGKSFLAMSAHARSAGEQYWVFDGRGTMDFQ
jgi:hypothetical protein